MTGILVAFGFMLLFALIASNRFVMLRKMSDKSFANVQKPIMKKYDLLNDVLTAIRKKNPSSEGCYPDIEEQLITLRKKADPENLPINNTVDVENQITAIIQELYDCLEQENITDEDPGQALSSLEEAENALQVSKQHYNDMVRHYNNAVYLFPSNVFALIFGYKVRETFTGL